MDGLLNISGSSNPEFLLVLAAQADALSTPAIRAASIKGEEAFYRARFQANLEFYGRMLMALFQKA